MENDKWGHGQQHITLTEVSLKYLFVNSSLVPIIWNWLQSKSSSLSALEYILSVNDIFFPLSLTSFKVSWNLFALFCFFFDSSMSSISGLLGGEGVLNMEQNSH